MAQMRQAKTLIPTWARLLAVYAAQVLPLAMLSMSFST
jgi:hypothetical protein